MLNYLRMKKFLALLVSLSMLGTSLPAYSGIVSTERMLEQRSAAVDRSALIGALERDDVRRLLIERGVDPAQARERVAALSDADVQRLQASIDQLPAGSGVIEILIAVILVLIILDVTGVTDIFSFVHPPSR